MTLRELLYTVRRELVLAERAKGWRLRLAERQAVTDTINHFPQRLDMLYGAQPERIRYDIRGINA